MATVNIPRESTLARVADALEESNKMSVVSFDEDVVASIDGTASSYKAQMRRWFSANGVSDVEGDPYALTDLCSRWYAVTRPQFLGWVDFYQTSVSAVTTGEAGGDLSYLACAPSTDEVAGADDFAGHALFAATDVNWVVTDDGTKLVTAIDGVTRNFERSNPARYVGVMQMAPWVCEVDHASTYRVVYSATRNVPYPVAPVAEAVSPDGSVSEFVIHAKYNASKSADGSLTCCAGVVPTAWQSHNAVDAEARATGSGYSGTSVCDDSWLKLQAMVKYRSLTLDGIIQGCCANDKQSYAAISETGVRRVVVAKNTSFEPGMNVLVGTYATSADRGTSSMYSISGSSGVKVTAVETVTVDGVEYTAVYVDTAEPFDTAANGNATSGTTYVSTFHWSTGSTDCVLGSDGSPKSCTSGKYPAKLQGIEFMVGGYEVLSDVILSLYSDADGAYWYEPYVVSTPTKRATSITSDYEPTGLKVRQPDSAGWQYIERLGYSKGAAFPIEVGGSSSTYTRDAFYMNANEVGTREWLCFGSLNHGSSNAGLSCLNGLTALSAGGWSFLARLSPNGFRGEWVP